MSILQNPFQSNAQMLLALGLFLVMIVVVVILMTNDDGSKPAESMKGGTNKVVATTRFKGLGEKAMANPKHGSVAAAVMEDFQGCVVENQMGDEPVLHAPPGVQPGTLVSPPYGETTIQPLYDSKYGFKSNFGKSVVENMEGASSNSGVFSRFKSRAEAEASLRRVINRFDTFFGTLFPGAVVEVREDDSFVIRQANQDACVYLENYYDYVGASIAKAMGNEPDTTLNWAKGSGISLDFKDIDENADALRVGLSVNCIDAAGYTTEHDVVKSLSTDQVIKYEIKWPEDQSILMTHYATFE